MFRTPAAVPRRHHDRGNDSRSSSETNSVHDEVQLPVKLATDLESPVAVTVANAESWRSEVRCGKPHHPTVCGRSSDVSFIFWQTWTPALRFEDSSESSSRFDSGDEKREVVDDSGGLGSLTRSTDNVKHVDEAGTPSAKISKGGADSVEVVKEPRLEHIHISEAPDIADDTESGWAAIAKSIREVDEQKVKDYKEDIDNILIFVSGATAFFFFFCCGHIYVDCLQAGLYSAVLSALLAESYQSLQPDQNAIMIKLLSQVVVQTHAYTMANGYLNSTAPPLDVAAVQHFVPSVPAKRVNVLWFASLTLSLISASFGILVKQWLREYLSGEYVSPQA